MVSDKSVEVKGGLAQCLMGLVKTPEDLSGLSLDSLLTLCLKGLEDSSVQVKQPGRCPWIVNRAKHVLTFIRGVSNVV